MKRYWNYLLYVLGHKLAVFQEGRSIGVPLLRLIVHDWDKFLPFMFVSYARCFNTPDGKPQYDENIDFARAWKKHQSINKHHWQYYLRVDGEPLPKTHYMVWDRGDIELLMFIYTPDGVGKWSRISVSDRSRVTADPMPEKYRKEMLADWLGVARHRGSDTRAWYNQNEKNIILHPITRVFLELDMLKHFTDSEDDHFFVHEGTVFVHPEEIE